MRCSNCGTSIREGNSYCTACGSRAERAGGSSRRWRFWALGGLLLFAGTILAVIHPPSFFRLVALLGLLLLVASIGIMLLTFRKAKRISSLALILSMGIALATLVIYTGILGVTPNTTTTLAGLAFGIAVGIGWALTAKLFNAGGQIMRRGSAWYLAVWGLVLAFTQLVTILTGRPPSIAVWLLVFGTGLVIGNSTTILVRSQRLRANLAGQRAR